MLAGIFPKRSELQEITTGISLFIYLVCIYLHDNQNIYFTHAYFFRK